MGLFISIAPAVAGQTVNDPLKKPTIWKRLVDDPKNDNLWQSYFGKDLFELTSDESRNYKKWKSDLVIAKRNKEQAETNKLLDKYKSGDSYVAKSPYLQKLMSNISKNFMLIEDYFDEEFDRYGASYEFYEDKYPKGEYNKVQWIEEHEKKLITLSKK